MTVLSIDFELVTLPKDMSGYNAAAFVEGPLSFKIGEQTFLNIEYCLLLELATVMWRWLTAEAGSDFYYASMDEEEEPRLALRYCESKLTYVAESCWATNQCDLDISQEDITACFEAYIKNLELVLYNKCGYIWNRE